MDPTPAQLAVEMEKNFAEWFANYVSYYIFIIINYPTFF